ncbi:hypothetical protein MAR_023192 [Mya arenaria]|uniref:Uncharacterized protein n=1 Tax=Mya arenaria TaxID=6604 RepID=A0ABY7DMA1_MYAAR|nr:hypothetical protein MAR_023192 [Mya arenaria]
MSAAEVVAPIIKQKTGQDFLESTSFRIGQDDQLTNQRMDSIFKSDYPPYGTYGRPAGARPPPLSEVMHRDQKFFSERESETTKSFEYRHLPKPEIQGASGKLRVTNFKMDRDISKFNNFETVHNSYFTPKMGDAYKRVEGAGTRQSNIPQGDREKEPQPLTDYRDIYNVPTGDPRNVVERETTMNASFQDMSNQNQRQPYNTEHVSKVLNQTNFKQQDGHYKWNDYRSTATSSYMPSVIPVERFKPGKHRNHSDFPEGDLDNQRVNERVNLTTNRFYHGNPPRGLHNTIISGANLRTRSNVWFGEPLLGSSFYNTTNSRSFSAKTVPYTYNRQSFYKESDIPVNYYGKGERNHTTAFSDYKDPRKVKTAPNSQAIENLKMSHILPPISNLRNFNTTHNDTFYPKSSERYSYDAGRLQKSSVPLGTMAGVSD